MGDTVTLRHFAAQLLVELRLAMSMEELDVLEAEAPDVAMSTPRLGHAGRPSFVNWLKCTGLGENGARSRGADNMQADWFVSR
jgi:hypothetical protein